MVALLAAPLGAIADRTGARKPWVLAFSVPYVIGCAGLWLATPGMPDPWLALGFFILAYLGSEFGQILTNAMLPDLAGRAEIGRSSGSGRALGYLGGLASLAFVLAFLSPAPGAQHTLLGIPPVFGLDAGQGEPARATGPMSALWYIVFALPLFLWTPDAPPGQRRGAVRGGLADLAAMLRNVRRHRSLAAYLVASMVYRDALYALFVCGGIYAAGVLGWGITELGLFGIVAAGIGAIGAWAGGRGDGAFGPKPVIDASNIVLIGLCIVLLMPTRNSVLGIAVPPGSLLPDAVFFAAGGVLGAMAGALQSASRTMLVHQAEGHVAHAQAFGLYALSGRATAFIGPALIAAATSATGSQRLGISPVILLFLLGLFLPGWVKTPTEQSMAVPT
jgi:UMF1 family MFS transporter